MTRRAFLPAAAATPLALAATRKGRLKQSVCRWCYKKIALEDLAREAAVMGIQAMDLIGPDEWPVVKKYGLTPAMTTGGGTIPDGLNRKENHGKIEQQFRENIPTAAAAGVPHQNTLFGNPPAQDDAALNHKLAVCATSVAIRAAEKNVDPCSTLHKN